MNRQGFVGHAVRSFLVAAPPRQVFTLEKLIDPRQTCSPTPVSGEASGIPSPNSSIPARAPGTTTPMETPEIAPRRPPVVVIASDRQPALPGQHASSGPAGCPRGDRTVSRDSRTRQGGFGRVYLARDDQLARHVAVKVPNRERVARPEDIEAYLAEARIARQPRPSPHRPGLRRRPDRRRALLRRLEVYRRYRPVRRMRRGRLASREAAEMVADRRRGACTMPTREASSTATSSPPTSCSTPRAGPASPTSGWR